MTADSDPGNTQMPIQPQPQPQPQSSGSGCQKVMGALTLLLLVVMLVLGMLVWNAVGGFFDGIGQGITGLGESIGGTVGEGFESLGNTVSGISQGITELGTFVGALSQSVADSVNESLANISETVSSAVEDALRTEMRADLETRVLLAESLNLKGMLVTASQDGDADVKVGVQAGLLNLCGASVNHIAEGTIEAGVDISQVQADDIFHDPLNDRWVLNLGAARLHSCRIDYIRQQGHSFTACRQDWDAYRLLAESAAIEEIRDEALVEGLLAGAEQQAQIVLGNFLSSVTGSDNITIVFKSEPNIEFPESCLREPPPGWVFDEESDTWKRE